MTRQESGGLGELTIGDAKDEGQQQGNKGETGEDLRGERYGQTSAALRLASLTENDPWIFRRNPERVASAMAGA
jgi:hypothetical protein